MVLIIMVYRAAVIVADLNEKQHQETRKKIEVIRKYLLDIYKEVRKKDKEELE